MKLRTFILIISLIGILFVIGCYLLFSPQKSGRLLSAYEEKKDIIAANLKEKNLSLDNIHILISAYKYEQELDIYVKNKEENKYELLETYPICAKSGDLGPKSKAGDKQVPEGFYFIDRFNPMSTYYLSLGLNYPNEADKLRSDAEDLGGDIYIHGECVTIGCMPMTNDKIKEIYVYALQAKENGQDKIPVYIFPFRMNDENMRFFQERYALDMTMLNF